MNDNVPTPDDEEPPEADAEVLSPEADERETELQQTKDHLLRALAEQENVRRRAQRDKDEAIKYSVANFAKDLLSSADNLRRAIESIKPEQVKDDVLKNLLDGVAATERELLGAFEKNAIVRIDPMGDKFDHNFHQAIFEVEHSGQVAGTVVQVLQPGYTLHDRLLRPAMVGVAKGPVAESDGKPGKQDDGPGPHHRVDTTV